MCSPTGLVATLRNFFPVASIQSNTAALACRPRSKAHSAGPTHRHASPALADRGAGSADSEPAATGDPTGWPGASGAESERGGASCSSLPSTARSSPGLRASPHALESLDNLAGERGVATVRRLALANPTFAIVVKRRDARQANLRRGLAGTNCFLLHCSWLGRSTTSGLMPGALALSRLLTWCGRPSTQVVGPLAAIWR